MTSNLKISLLLVMLLPLNLAAGEELLNSCQTCHKLDKVCKKLGKDQLEWHKTVKRMNNYMSVKGGALTEAEVAELAEFLAERKPGDKEICR